MVGIEAEEPVERAAEDEPGSTEPVVEPREGEPVAAVRGSGGATVEGAVAKALGLEPGTELDAATAVELLGVLVEMTRGMDQVMWSTWKVLAPLDADAWRRSITTRGTQRGGRMARRRRRLSLRLRRPSCRVRVTAVGRGACSHWAKARGGTWRTSPRWATNASP